MRSSCPTGQARRAERIANYEAQRPRRGRPLKNNPIQLLTLNFKTMKNVKFIFLLATLLAVGFTFPACGDGATKQATDTEMEGQEYTSAYVCPMHCEGSGSAMAGTCPVCGMDYVANADHKADGHHHDTDAGHEEGHDDHDGHEH